MHVSKLGDFALSQRAEVVSLTRRGTTEATPPSVESITVDLATSIDRSVLPSRVDAVVLMAQSHRFRDFPHGARDMFAVNTASVAGYQGAPTYAPYVASKAAVIGVTRTAALELAPRNIRVNAVCPGTVDTPMAYGDEVNAELKIASMMMPLGRLCQPEEVAALFHFLVADDCPFISGQAICIDGGMTAGISMGLVLPLLENM